MGERGSMRSESDRIYDNAVRRVRPFATCHPTLPHRARGMCGACYCRWQREEKKARRDAGKIPEGTSPQLANNPAPQAPQHGDPDGKK